MGGIAQEFEDWWRVAPNPVCPPWCESHHGIAEFTEAGAISHCATLIDTPRVTVERVLWQSEDDRGGVESVEKLRVTTHRPDGTCTVSTLDASPLVARLRTEFLSLREPPR